MKYSLYDVQLAIAEHLTQNGIEVQDNPSDSDFPFVVLDVSMNLNGTMSEAGRLFGITFDENKIVGVKMPFILNAFVYGGNNATQQENKANIEHIFLNTFRLLNRWWHSKEKLDISINGMTSIQWVQNPILEQEKVDSTILKITMEGRAVYE